MSKQAPNSNAIAWLSLAVAGLTLVVTSVTAWQTHQFTAVTKSRELAIQEIAQAMSVLQAPSDSAVAKELKEFATLTLKRRVSELTGDDSSKQWKKLSEREQELNVQALVWQNLREKSCFKMEPKFWDEASEQPKDWVAIPYDKKGASVEVVLKNYVENLGQYKVLAARYRLLVRLIEIHCASAGETASIGKTTAESAKKSP